MDHPLGGSVEIHVGFETQLFCMSLTWKKGIAFGRNLSVYRQLSLNGHLYKTDTSLRRTPGVGHCRVQSLFCYN